MSHKDDSFEADQHGVDWETLFGDRQLVVVSNRQPYTFEDSGGEITVNRPVGGLTAGIDPLMQRTSGTWIAWGEGDADEEVVDDADQVDVPPEDPQYTLRCLWLSDEQVEGYYYGFSNQVLWPICHSALGTVRAEQSFWEQYKRTNEQFAGGVVDEVGRQPVVWFHDYHLALAPRMVRQRLGSEPLLVQFWHIPWPEWDVFRACPHGEEIVRGLLGNDMLGFHVDRYGQNFLESVDAMLPEATIDWQSWDVSHSGGHTHVEAVPMGVPLQEVQVKAATYREREFRSFKRSCGIDADTRVAVGVDRLDYSKGIPERLRALERLWERSPEWRGSLTYVQNGSESRSEIPAYSRLQDEVEGAVDRINDRFGTADWQPIVRVDEYLNERELYGLYRHADLALVSSVRDGMNLVAAEYAAAQIEGDGVLVLSTQTGAHDLFGEFAVSVSPFAPEQFATQIESALRMPKVERQSRMQRIRRTVAANDLWSWLRGVAETAQAVERTRPAPGRHDATTVGHDAY